jgi:hypothetical protein
MTIAKTLKEFQARHGGPKIQDRQYKELPSGDYHTHIRGVKIRLSPFRSSWTAELDDRASGKDSRTS